MDDGKCVIAGSWKVEALMKISEVQSWYSVE